MKFLTLLSILLLSSCITNNRISSRKEFIVIDTMVLNSSHYHFELYDEIRCIELEADTVISKNKFTKNVRR